MDLNKIANGLISHAQHEILAQKVARIREQQKRQKAHAAMREWEEFKHRAMVSMTRAVNPPMQAQIDAHEDARLDTDLLFFNAIGMPALSKQERQWLTLEAQSGEYWLCN